MSESQKIEARDLLDGVGAKKMTTPDEDFSYLLRIVERATAISCNGGSPRLSNHEWQLISHLVKEIGQLKADNERVFKALDQLIDDMRDGHCVCPAAKQQAIAALKGMDYY
jgi:predicted nucleotidyltransferase component of viral defense system